MADRSQRGNKEKKKPKADKNLKKKGMMHQGAGSPSPFSPPATQPGSNPYGKKG